MSTPAQLREAADYLARAIAVDDGSVCEATNIVHEAEKLFEDAEGRALPGMETHRDGLGLVGNWHDHYDVPDGWRWLAGAARLRLLVEALHLEQAARLVLVGPRSYSGSVKSDACIGCGARVGETHRGTCDWEMCGKCEGLRLGCDCDQEELSELIEAFMADVRT